ncbi:MAG: GFA family protein [Pseudomonadales bacterium]
MLKGSCLCGAVTYEVAGSALSLGHCHCHMCQKFHGAPFGSYVRVTASELRILTGAERVVEYRSSPQVTRSFCGRCGSPLLFQVDGRSSVGVAAGSLDGDPGVRPSYQIWTASKAPWWELDPGVPAFAADR